MVFRSTLNQFYATIKHEDGGREVGGRDGGRGKKKRGGGHFLPTSMIVNKR